jgi:hypothetical protein
LRGWSCFAPRPSADCAASGAEIAGARGSETLAPSLDLTRITPGSGNSSLNF